MTNHISPGLMMVPYSMDRVEFRRGVWNAESTTLEDDDATGTLWPALDLLSQGLQPPEIVSRVPGRSISRDTKRPRNTRMGIPGEVT